jgi:hypothetical protein
MVSIATSTSTAVILNEALKAYGGSDKLSQVCLDYQIKVRFSDRLAGAALETSPMVLETIEELKAKLNQQNEEIVRLTAQVWRNTPTTSIEETPCGLRVGGLTIPCPQEEHPDV